AEYRAVLAVAAPDGTIVATADGVCRGRIGRERRGSGGFGYDPLFIPTGGQMSPAPPLTRERTMSELSAEEKDAISHRGEAFRRLRAALATLAAPP
ncbi:MAG TPA: non-canonical purine NTP pyrophosphatase, partial [Anaeromyxobacter sp.]